MRRPGPMVGALLLLAIAMPVTTDAMSIHCVPAKSAENLGDCTGTLVYNSAATHELTITLNNTTGVESFITGLSFNNPAGAISALVLASATINGSVNANWEFTFDDDTNPYGTFDYKTAITKTPPKNGVPDGKQGVFVYDVTANFGAMTDAQIEAAFKQEFSAGPQGDLSKTANVWGLVRFQGIAPNDGSDKTPLAADPTQQVPAPGALVMLGSGMVTLGLLGRKLRSRAKPA